MESDGSTGTGDALIVAIKVVGVAVGFVLFYGGGALLGWLVLPSVRLVSWRRVRGQRRCQRIVSGAFRLMLWYISVIGIYTTGLFARDGSPLEGLDGTAPAVVIANHPSLLDIVLLKAKLGHGAIVVKPIYYFNPFLGLLAWCCGYIRGGDSVGQGMAVIRESVARLSEGSTVILFPEGTRSAPEGLLPFRRGAFRIAEQSGAPLVPIWITCDPRVLGRGQGLAGYPSRRRVHLDAFVLCESRVDRNVNDARVASSQWESEFQKISTTGGLRRGQI